MAGSIDHVKVYLSVLAVLDRHSIAISSLSVQLQHELGRSEIYGRLCL